jgi:hypothetical protein
MTTTDTDNAADSSEELTRDDLEKIIDTLRFHEDGFPGEAIQAAEKHFDQLYPLLIEGIDEDLERLKRERIYDSGLPVIGLHLFAQYRRQDAMPTVLKTLVLPSDDSERFYGDVISENMDMMLAILAEDLFSVIETVWACQHCDEWMLAAVLQAMLYQVATGILDRDTALQWLSQHITPCIEQGQEPRVNAIAYCMIDFCDVDGITGPIQLAREMEVIDESLIDDQQLQNIVSGEECWENKQSKYDHPAVDSTFDIMSEWHWNRGEEDEDYDEYYGDMFEKMSLTESFDDTYQLDREVTNPAALTTAETTGRNDPCPCGSGRKYKKCCLKKSNA